MSKARKAEELPYFAYGSNLDPYQMARRIPGAAFQQPAFLPDHAFQFQLRPGVPRPGPSRGRAFDGGVTGATRGSRSAPAHQHRQWLQSPLASHGAHAAAPVPLRPLPQARRQRSAGSRS